MSYYDSEATRYDATRGGDERADGKARITSLAAQHGLLPIGETTFTGVGQGRRPADWTERVAGRPDLRRRLAALPDQEKQRMAPTYHLVAYA